MKRLIEPPGPPSARVAAAAPAAAQPLAPGVPPAPGPSVAAAPKTFSVVDLKQYFHIIVRRIWLVALCFVISLAVTVVNLVRQVPVFRASTTLLMSRGLPLPETVKQQERILIGDIIETETRIAQSSLVVARAREKVNRPAEEVGQKLVRVAVFPIGKTAILAISVDALDPQFAADFANAMADAYLEFKAEERMETSQSTVISLTQQASRLREELKRAEDRVVQFKKDNSVVAIQERGNVAANTLASLATRAASYRTERMILEAQQPMLSQASDDIVLATLASPMAAQGLWSVPIASAAGSTQMVSLSRGPEALIERGVTERPAWGVQKQQKARLEGRLAQLRERLRDDHPEIRSVLAAIKDLEQSLSLEVQFALQQYYTRLEALQVQEQAMHRVETEWEDEALESTRKADEFGAIQRDVSRLRSLYDLVFNRLKEIDIATGIEPETIRVLERASPSSSPITPRRMQSIFMAALLGLGIGLGLIFGLEFLDDSIRYPEEVARDLGVRFFGVIPAANWDPEDLRTHLISNIDQKSGLAEAYRNVRSALLFAAEGRNIKTLVVASAVPKEGKTTTSLNLAVSLAQAGFRVLLVDGDLRRGELHKFFGLEGGRGLADVLVGQAKPESVIQRTGLPNLDLVATGPFPPNPAELILRNEFNSFMDYARRTYDRVLFDCPPIMAVSEAGILASLVDGVIMVVWAGQTSRKLSQMALQIIRQRGANLLGCILNNLEFGRVGYYYYSTYYGYYDYDYRYDRPQAPKKPA